MLQSVQVVVVTSPREYFPAGQTAQSESASKPLVPLGAYVPVGQTCWLWED